MDHSWERASENVIKIRVFCNERIIIQLPYKL